MEMNMEYSLIYAIILFTIFKKTQLIYIKPTNNRLKKYENINTSLTKKTLYFLGTLRPFLLAFNHLQNFSFVQQILTFSIVFCSMIFQNIVIIFYILLTFYYLILQYWHNFQKYQFFIQGRDPSTSYIRVEYFTLARF